MHIIFVHGWSVTHTDTYGELPAWLEQQSRQNKIQNIYLGKYISFVDTVTLDDIARAFEQALQDELGSKMKQGFACITHSTGGPVIRLWMTLYHGRKLSLCPMKHLIMLAPANHGSALAQLGKKTISRLKGLFDGTEPGVGVLDWLELGSEQSWELNATWLSYNCTKNGIYLFVLTGQSIDRKFYDHLNSYTGEAGSDGVVRAAAANMNYQLLELEQTDDKTKIDVSFSRRGAAFAFGILPGLAHSGDECGIIRSVTRKNAAGHPTAIWVARCLAVSSAAGYKTVCEELAAVTEETQKLERDKTEKKLFGTKHYLTSRYSMIVFRLIDDRGAILSDYDLYITAGPKYSPDDLPEGFFVDRQRNRRYPGKLTYFVDHDVLREGLNNQAMEGRIGFRVVARPEAQSDSLAYYHPLNFESDQNSVSKVLRAHETLMIQIKLRRCVDARVFRIESGTKPGPIVKTPTGKRVP